MVFESHLKAIFMVLTALLSSTVQASWVDPDTPEEFRTTEPINVKPPPLPKPYVYIEKKEPKKHPTNSPTPAPTTTPYPSNSPSNPPTFFPTYTPKTFELVFSDEFNTPGRSFEDGVDPRWTALDKNDYTNDALHYYSPDNVKTSEQGELVITAEAADTEVIGFDDVKRKKTRVTKHFKSAMLQSWNKFCITGGIVEARVTMPGKYDVGGLWPAFWLLGNLARHTYVGSSDHIWPWSSNVCTSKSGAQKISACNNVEHFGMKKHVGRGAPEIDIFEAQPGNIKANTGAFKEMSVGQPFISTSFQVAPGRPTNRPGNGYWPGPGQWYEGLRFGHNTTLNIQFYGTYNHFRESTNFARDDYWSDAVSFNRQLTNSHFNESHVYRLEWDVPSNTSDGYLNWFLDGELVFALNGTGLKKAGIGSEISTEPSYILFNLAVSKQWGFPLKCPSNCPCKNYDCRSTDWRRRCGFSENFCKMMFPENRSELPKYKIDWVRVYQNPNDPNQKVGCSTPERPTRQYIKAHEQNYKNANDLQPLKVVQRGSGTCNSAASGVTAAACGGSERGRCTKGSVCECLQGWTGPHCLVSQAYDQVQYDVPDKISDVGFIAPSAFPRHLVAGLATLAVLLTLALRFRRRMEGWTPIPDAILKRQSSIFR